MEGGKGGKEGGEARREARSWHYKCCLLRCGKTDVKAEADAAKDIEGQMKASAGSSFGRKLKRKGYNAKLREEEEKTTIKKD